MSAFSTNLISVRKFLGDLEDRVFTQERFAALCLTSKRQIVRWEKLFYEPSPKQIQQVADGISRYFGRIGLQVAAEDVLRSDFVEWLKEKVLDSAGRGDLGGTYSERSLGVILAQESMCQLLGIDDLVIQFFRSKLLEYRADLTEQDWLAIFQLYQQDELVNEEWKFKDPDVVAARLHFKSPRPLTAKELKVAEQAARDAVRAYQLQEQAKRKKESE